MAVNLSIQGLEEKRNEIVKRTLHWWDRNRRDLLWRSSPGETPDPYRVWLSEVLLQQTTAKMAAPYFQAFMQKWPTVGDLAAASGEAVIGAFAGLGYYSRARNLHACAKEIERRGGQFPSEESDLRALPGIGTYTASAIAAIAFGCQTAPVDGNITRILARLLAMEQPVVEAKKYIASAARALAPSRRAGDFAQALMDIGATLCRPRNPDCGSCPLTEDCAAFQSGDPKAFPRRNPPKSKQFRAGAVFFAHREDGAFLVRRRPKEGLLASTVELPGSAWTNEGPGERWREDVPVLARWRQLTGVVEQAFTHFALSLAVYAAEYDGSAPEGCFWIGPDRIADAGLSNIMRKAVAHAIKGT